jgi:COMM domain
MWREAAVDGRVGLPRLVECDWEVNNAEGSSAVSKFAIPSVTLGLTLQDNATSVTELPKERTVAVEIDYKALNVVVDDMRRIKDLLDSMTGSSKAGPSEASS